MTGRDDYYDCILLFSNVVINCYITRNQGLGFMVVYLTGSMAFQRCVWVCHAHWDLDDGFQWQRLRKLLVWHTWQIKTIVFLVWNASVGTSMDFRPRLHLLPSVCGGEMRRAAEDKHNCRLVSVFKHRMLPPDFSPIQAPSSPLHGSTWHTERLLTEATPICFQATDLRVLSSSDSSAHDP